MDLLQGSSPKLAELSRFDAAWHGIGHRNICVQLRDGSAVIMLDGAPDYVLYYVPKTYTLAREVPGSITIVTPDEPHAGGSVCLGIADGTPAVRIR